MTAHRNAAAERLHQSNCTMTASSIRRRQQCDRCREILSIGQFPQGSCVCIGCAPQGLNFRRGF
jgi:hypothetical protein